jgi:hypothetical protein
MDTPETKHNLDDIADDSVANVTAKDLKIILSVIKIGASRGLFKPEEFSLLGELNGNVRKSLTELVEKK